jgi:hypothetical protein
MKDTLITILTSGFTTAIVLALYRHFLSRNIEAFKSNLLFDSQRKVHDFQLFTTKKHETYPKLYGLFYKATDSIFNVTNWYQQYPDFMEHTKTDLENYLSNHDLLEKDKGRIFYLWETDKKEMQKELHNVIQHKKFFVADTLRLEAYQLFSETLLYQSETVAELCEKIVGEQRQLLLEHDWYREEVEIGEKKEIREKVQLHRERLEELRKELLEIMKEELTVGYYENPEKKSS